MSSQYNNINQAVTPDYYQEAGEVSENMFTNPGFVDILGYLKDCTSILEVGCGNGVKTIQMSRINQRSAGCDISSYAIEQARTSYPGIDFFVSDCLQITQPDATYDGVYSFFVLEHVEQPQRMLEEMIRVTKPGGIIAIMCPNFASPFFPSPPTKYRHTILQKIALIIRRFYHAVTRYYSMPTPLNSLQFQTVTPITTEYKSDYDTVNEPDLLQLTHWFRDAGHEVLISQSLWSEARPQWVFAIFRRLQSLFLFRYWGPQVCLVVRKKNL